MDHATLEAITSDVCHSRLRGLILDAHLLPNSHHMEVAIAERLASDQSTVHQAVVELQQEGLVSLEPREGFWISPVAPSSVIESFRHISTLEARAAFVAALHSPSSLCMAALDDAIFSMESSLYRGDLESWASANHHFHRSLLQCSEHTGLIEAALPLSETIHRTRMLTVRLGPPPVEATHNYARVVEAIRGGLAADARDLHLNSWRSAARRIVKLLKDNRLNCLTA